MIEIQNPNRVVKKVSKHEDASTSKEPVKVELSRREKEEIQKQQDRERYAKLHAEGKTDEARADLARLALIRRQREEAAKKREVEKASKESTSKSAAAVAAIKSTVADVTVSNAGATSGVVAKGKKKS